MNKLILVAISFVFINCNKNKIKFHIKNYSQSDSLTEIHININGENKFKGVIPYNDISGKYESFDVETNEFPFILEITNKRCTFIDTIKKHNTNIYIEYVFEKNKFSDSVYRKPKFVIFQSANPTIE